ncbi:MAG: hypothetical protein Q7T05_03565 [Dehalococcoidia bacterium]|nr:hypothetical protein [Dehalococcoidia bacterium]
MSESSREELLRLVRSTESMKQIFSDLEREPVKLLCAVCQEYRRSGKTVPDHRLALFSYFAEASLRALVGAGLLKMLPGGSTSIYEYEPTGKGSEIYDKLIAEGFCKA